MDGSWWRVLTKCAPLDKGIANHFSILALRTPWTVWKGILPGTNRNYFIKLIKSSESESHSFVSESLRPHGLYSPWNSPGQNTGVGNLSLLQGLPNPGMEPRSPALQADYLPAEPWGKTKNTGVGSLSLLQWIFPTQELNWVSCIAGGFFTNWAIREDHAPKEINSVIIGRTDAECEVPILWPPDAKSLLIGKDPDTGKYRKQQKGRTEGSITDSISMSLSKLQDTVTNREA